MAYFDGIKIEDRVWSFEFGWGKVEKIIEDLKYGYLIVVWFYDKKVIEKYSMDGISVLKNKKQNQTLFWEEIKFKIPKRKKFPIYKKNDFMVVKYLTPTEFEIIFIFNKEKHSISTFGKIGSINSNFSIHDKQWRDVAYDEERGLWDGQPVWVWDSGWTLRMLRFYDAVNKNTFGVTNRNTLEYDFYESYPHLEDEWIIEAYNKLKFD